MQAEPLLLPRILIVTDPREWDDLVDCQQPLVLIPRFNAQRSYGLAVRRGHHVIAVESNRSPQTADPVTVGKADKRSLEKALATMGLSEEAAKAVLRQTRGYLAVIRRHPTLAPQDVQTPAWVQSDEAAIFTAALIAGSWRTDNEGDKEQLARLSGMSYSDFEQILYRWAITDYSPVRLIGGVWQLVSRPDAWSLLSPFINAAMLDRVEAVILKVLGEIDPRFELPIDERWFANARGKMRIHSGGLCHGLAEALSMLGAYGDTDCRNVGPTAVQDRVSHCVYRLLTEKPTEDIWRSLAGILPELAEAAPDEFLQAVERGLQGPDPTVMCLFEDQGQWGECFHSGLLWALEGLSWNTSLLSRVVRVLSKLAWLDPGGRWTNRPRASLKQIFLGWYPQTTVPLNRRMQIIDGLIRAEPKVGWQLLLDLLPEAGGSISHPIHKPTCRDWADAWTAGVTHEENFEHVEAVGDRVMQYVDSAPALRWPEVIDALPRLTPRCFDLGVEKLIAFSTTGVLEGCRKLIADKVRHIVSQHREFADASWALAPAAVDKLAGVLPLYLAEDLVERHRYLFDEDVPELLPYRRQNHNQRYEVIEEWRQKALIEIWTEEGLAGLEKLAAGAKLSWLLGNMLGKVTFSSDIEEGVLAWLDRDNINFALCTQAYVHSRVELDPTWINKIESRYRKDWSTEKWAAFALGVPFGKRAFDLLNKLGNQVSSIFWKKVRGCYLQDEDAEFADLVLRELVNHDRPLAAIDIAAHYLQTLAARTGLDSETLAGALQKAALIPADQNEVPGVSLGYDIALLIKHLQSAEDIDADRLARIEWMYIHMFQWNDVEPRTLINHILKNPAFFVHIICLRYKPDVPQLDEDHGQSPELLQQQARNTWELLQLVKRIPGQEGEQVDVNQLDAWIRDARKGCSERARSAVGDIEIGELLSWSPVGADGAWPHEAVRDLLEYLENEDIERGLGRGRYNQRGTTSRSLDEGGNQERALAEQYQAMAIVMQDAWPRTAAVLMRLAKTYRRDAGREDDDRDLRE